MKKDRPEYEAYISSSRWDRRKAAYYSKHPRACRACDATDQIHLHHQTYARLGCEHDDDLVPLCEPCHVLVHKYHRASRMTLMAATKNFVELSRGEKPVARKRSKPRTSSARRRTAARPARKLQPVKPSVAATFQVGDRVVIAPDGKVALQWAGGKAGVIRSALTERSWIVELDDVPGSRLAVTMNSARPERSGDPVNAAMSKIREHRRADVRSVSCPACRAPAGQPCIRSRGGERESNHRERIWKVR